MEFRVVLSTTDKGIGPGLDAFKEGRRGGEGHVGEVEEGVIKSEKIVLAVDIRIEEDGPFRRTGVRFWGHEVQ
jgi:hypothetical protein